MQHMLVLNIVSLNENNSRHHTFKVKLGVFFNEVKHITFSPDNVRKISKSYPIRDALNNFLCCFQETLKNKKIINDFCISKREDNLWVKK